MMKNIKIKGLMASLVGATMLFAASNANAADTGTMHPERNEYSSAGVFGKFDLPSIIIF